MRKALVLTLAVLLLGGLTALAGNVLTDLEVTGATILRGSTTIANASFTGSYSGDFDLNDILDIDANDDTYYAANIYNLGNGGGLYVKSGGTGSIFVLDDGGTVLWTVADGGAWTVGVSGTGYDFKWWSATAGEYFLWDESEDALIIGDGTNYVRTDSTNGITLAGTAKVTRRLYLPIDTGGGTATTETFMNSPSINVDTDDETFYASVPVPADWDGASDMTLYFAIANEIAETDGDDIIITLQIKGDADGEAMAANGQAPTCTLDLTGGDEAIDVVNLSTAVIDYNEGTYPIAVDDILKIKCSIGLGTGTEITGPTHIVAWWIEYTADQFDQ